MVFIESFIFSYNDVDGCVRDMPFSKSEGICDMTNDNFKDITQAFSKPAACSITSGRNTDKSHALDPGR